MSTHKNIKKYIYIEIKEKQNTGVSVVCQIKQANKTSQQKTLIKQTKIYMYSPSLVQWEKFDQVICCFCKNHENLEMPAKYFLQHRYHGCLLTSFCINFKSSKVL